MSAPDRKTRALELHIRFSTLVCVFLAVYLTTGSPAAFFAAMICAALAGANSGYIV